MTEEELAAALAQVRAIDFRLRFHPRRHPDGTPWTLRPKPRQPRSDAAALDWREAQFRRLLARARGDFDGMLTWELREESAVVAWWRALFEEGVTSALSIAYVIAREQEGCREALEEIAARLMQDAQGSP